MKKRIAALLLLALWAACAGNNASVQVYAICAPPSGECVFDATCDTQTSEAVLDTASSTTNQVLLFLQVNNQLTSNADPSVFRVNTHDAYVQEYTVEYEGAFMGSSTGRIQVVVPTGGSTVVPVTLAPGRTLGTVIAKIRLRGIYGDQSAFETAPFEVPVTVCSNCLFQACTADLACPHTVGQFPVTCPDAT